jgi:hypothetical protein
VADPARPRESSRTAAERRRREAEERNARGARTRDLRRALDAARPEFLMTFDSSHYVPVLKVKRGEKNALQELAPLLRARMTPLLEIVERRAEKTPAKHLQTAFKGFDAAVSGFGRYFLDCREIAPDGEAVAAQVFARASKMGTKFTPVTGITRTADVDAALAHAADGIAIRVTRDDFESDRIPRELTAFMRDRKLVHERVDLIVDLGPVDDFVAAGVQKMATGFLAEIPGQQRWRTLTLSACAFPLSMRGVDRHGFGLVARAEWQAWLAVARSRRGARLRIPTYSDCAIQHPSGVEGFDPRTMPVSAAIRYAVAKDWLLIKGESTRKTPPSVQFPQLATRLTNGDLKTHFAGADHCHGCQEMTRAAAGAKGLGSAEAWRRLGTIHHLTVAADALPSASST